jgi:hypothetical protein
MFKKSLDGRAETDKERDWSYNEPTQDGHQT